MILSRHDRFVGSEMRVDPPLGAEPSGRAATAALPAKDAGARLDADHRPTSTCLTCDVCGRARDRNERHRLVWDLDPGTGLVLRSEEHTSELQSLRHLVCRLL